MAERKGEEFREDLRCPGARNAQERRLLGPGELAPLTCLSTWRSLLAMSQTAALIAAAIALALATWPSPWILVCIVVLGTCQHALFILA
ncbi:MAG: fatty acid desaturase, partial [Ramlibacter sp.]